LRNLGNFVGRFNPRIEMPKGIEGSSKMAKRRFPKCNPPKEEG